jgi:hypothetical protein
VLLLGLLALVTSVRLTFKASGVFERTGAIVLTLLVIVGVATGFSGIGDWENRKPGQGRKGKERMMGLFGFKGLKALWPSDSNLKTKVRDAMTHESLPEEAIGSVAIAMAGGPFRGQRYIVAETKRGLCLVPADSLINPVGEPILADWNAFSVAGFRRSKLTALGGCELTLRTPDHKVLRLTFPRQWRRQGLAVHDRLTPTA